MTPKWKTQAFKFTVSLFEPNVEIDFGKLWQNAVGLELEQIPAQTKPQVQMFKSSTDGYRLFLKREWDQVEIDLLPPAPRAGYEPSSFGSFTSAAGKFKKFVQQWLNSDGWPVVNYVAIEAALMIEAKDRIHAHQIVLDLVPSLRIDPESDIDGVSFRINRPRLCSVRGKEIKINRIAEWEAVKAVDGAPFGANPTHLALLVLTMSTSFGKQVRYDARFQKSIIEQMIPMAVTISKEGDAEGLRETN
jgi:hypothetical protein